MGWRSAAFVLGGLVVAGSVAGGIYLRQDPAPPGGEHPEREGILEERAVAYWSAMLERDVLKLADFHLPTERTKQNWSRLRNVAKFTLGPPIVDSEKGYVRVEYTFHKSYPRMPALSRIPQERTFVQAWLWHEENWYLEPVERTFSGLADLKKAIETQGHEDLIGKEGGSSQDKMEAVAWTSDAATEDQHKEEGP